MKKKVVEALYIFFSLILVNFILNFLGTKPIKEFEFYLCIGFFGGAFFITGFNVIDWLSDMSIFKD